MTTGILLDRKSPKLGKVIILMNIVIFTVFVIIGAMSIGLFLLPAPLALGYAVLWNEI